MTATSNDVPPCGPNSTPRSTTDAPISGDVAATAIYQKYFAKSANQDLSVSPSPISPIVGPVTSVTNCDTLRETLPDSEQLPNNLEFEGALAQVRLKLAARSSETWDDYQSRKRERHRAELESRFLTLSNCPDRHRDTAVTKSSLEWGNGCSKALAQADVGAIVALLGNRGVGKTQIAAECIRSVCRIPKSALYTRAQEIFVSVRECYRKDSANTERSVIDRYANPHLLVIDECQERGHTDAENRILALILDMRYCACRPTILIANATAEEFRKQIGESIFDRLAETGGIIECKWASFRANAQAVRNSV